MATPTFGTFGKTANNLLNQKFEASKDDFRNQASIKTQSNGFTITSTAVNGDENKLSAKVNIKHQDKQYGETTLEYNTAGKLKAMLKLAKLQPGLVVNTEAELFEGDITGKATAEYVTGTVATTAEYQKKGNAFNTSLVYGFDGVSVGGAVKADISGLTSGEPDFKKNIKPDVGIQYEDGNLIGALTYEGSGQSTLTIFHRVNPELQLATRGQVNAKGQSIAIGAQYKLNASTVVKGKTIVLNDGSHSFYGHIQHRLAQPDLCVGVSSTWNSDKSSAVGISLDFGSI